MVLYILGEIRLLCRYRRKERVISIKYFLIKLDHLITEKLNHCVEQIKYGKGIDFSIASMDGYRGGGYKDGISYQATVFIDYRMVKSLNIEKSDSILDIGCGKGKMVYWFSKMGFGKSDGLEYSKELVRCAEKNMKILKRDCKIIHADAALFDGYSNYNYYYFANPFGKETMRSVIDKIEESYNKKPRKIIIIYHNPLCHNTIIESGFFHLVCSNKNLYRKITGRVENVYSNE